MFTCLNIVSSLLHTFCGLHHFRLKLHPMDRGEMEGNWFNRWMFGVYFQILFYLNLIFSRLPYNPFDGYALDGYNQRLDPKRLIKQMKNLAGEDADLINPDETIEETFANKIAEHDYETAMRLAKKFDLDIDLIYKSKWLDNPVDIELIDECFTKISTPSWSLQKCLDYVPTDFETTEYLFKFCLRLSSNELNKNKVADGEKEEEEKRLLEEQAEFESYNHQIHSLLERLVIYKEILKKKHSTEYENYFDARYYQQFRKKSIFELAIDCANKADYVSLSILFRYKQHLLQKHILVILGDFPETIPPTMYSEIIKLITLTSKIDQPRQSVPIEPTPGFDATLDVDAFYGNQFEEDFYNKRQHLLKFILTDEEEDATTQTVHDFFRERTLQILDETMLVDNSLQLLEFGLDLSLPLEELYIELDLYSVLIYDSLQGCVPFAEFEAMPLIDKMKMALNKNDVPFMIEKIIEKFLEKILKQSTYKGATVSRVQVLKELLTSLAKENFGQCLKILEICTIVDKTPQDISKIKIINDPCALVELAVECLNQYEDADELATAFRIIECLPDRSQVDMIIVDDPVKVRQFNKVSDEVDRIESFLSLIDVFFDYNIKLTVKDLANIASERDRSKVHQVINKMIHKFCTVSFDKTDVSTEFKNFLWNLDDFRRHHLDSTLTLQELIEISVRSLLFSADQRFIRLAINYINFKADVRPEKKLDFEVGKRLLLEAANDYVNFCDASQSANIQYAKLCLEALQSRCAQDEAIMEELNFVHALEIIFEEFALGIQPIRMKTIAQPRLEILDLLLASSSTAYLKIDKIMLVAKLLAIGKDHDKNWREGMVLQAIGKQALEHNDTEFASNICKIILEKNLKSAWQLCHMFASTSSVAFGERLALLSFALTFLPEDDVDKLYEILNLIKSIKSSNRPLKNEHIIVKFKGDTSVLDS